MPERWRDLFAFSAFLRRTANRLSGFVASTLVQGVGSLICVSLTISLLGEVAWTQFAVGQAIGSVGAVVVGYGWDLTGPALVARLGFSDRGTEYSRSIQTRVLLLILSAAFISIGLTFGPFSRFVASLPIALAYSGMGLSSMWFFVGIGDGRSALMRESLPRALSFILAPLVAASFGGLTTFALVLIFGQFISIAACVLRVQCLTGVRVVLLPRFSDFRDSLVRHRSGFVGGLVSSVYLSVPVVALGLVSPTAVAMFALADKLVKFSSQALRPFAQVLQGWIPAGRREDSIRRIKRGLTVAIPGSMVSGVALVLLSPLFVSVLGREVVVVDSASYLPMALTLAMTLISQVVGPGCLVALGKDQVIAWSAVAGAGLGLILVFPLGAHFQAAGALWSVACAESLVTIVQLAFVIRIVRG